MSLLAHPADLWIVTATCVLLSVGLPFLSWHRFMRPEAMRERYLLSRSRGVPIACVAVIVGLSVLGLGYGILSVAYPFLWGAFAMTVSGAGTAVLYLVLFLRAGRQLLAGIEKEQAG